MSIPGNAPLAQMRLDEIVFLLQELARLSLHPSTAVAVDISTSHTERVSNTIDHFQMSIALPRFVGSEMRQLGWEHAHLLLLFSPLCELVTTRYVSRGIKMKGTGR